MGEQEIHECPFCGGECDTSSAFMVSHYVVCQQCGYEGPDAATEQEAIAAHNELCALVDKGRKYDTEHARAERLAALVRTYAAYEAWTWAPEADNREEDIRRGDCLQQEMNRAWTSLHLSDYEVADAPSREDMLGAMDRVEQS